MAAQQNNLPLSYSETLNLPQLGIAQDAIRFGAVTMESENYICVREANGAQTNICIIDMTKGNSIERRPINADSAIMNPVSKVIALRGGQNLQIFNIEMKARVKSHKMPDSETVQFWRWISSNTIAIVTPTSVYHWSMDGGSEPVKQFERHAKLQGGQIINYHANADGKWLVLVGINQAPSGAIVGNLQLYSVEQKMSQPLQGHAGCFANVKVNGYDRNVFCFVERKLDAAGALSAPKLYVMEVGKAKDAPGGVFKLVPQDIPFAENDDFPVTLLASKKYDMLYLITKKGYFFMFDIHSGSTLVRQRISQDTIFACTQNEATGGILGITARTGRVLSLTANTQNLVPYVVSTLRNPQLAISLAKRLDLPGAEELYTAEFQRLMSVNDLAGAAKLAAESPQGLLRTPETINLFKQLPATPGQPAPVLQYFSVLLENTKLNKVESIELVRPVLQQGRMQLLEKWLKEDKLECSEQLGDMIIQFNADMALSIYLRAQATEKVINCFMTRGEFDKIVAYCSKVGFRPDWTFLLQNIARQNPKGAESFAKKLVANEGGPLVEVNVVVDVFLQQNCIQEATSFMLEALKPNRPADAVMQTRLLEINLLGGAPHVAEGILASEMFSHYDRPRIAGLCEKAGLYQRALEHFSDIEDIKRVIQFTHAINMEWLVNYFGTLSAENCLLCLNLLMENAARQPNLQTVVQVATKFNEQLTSAELISLFEKYRSMEGLFYYLGGIVNVSEDPQVHFKYIQAAAETRSFKEVERVCRDSTVYDAAEVKDFLMSARLPDPRPLIHVCDRHGFVEDLTGYLHQNSLDEYIKVYVKQVSPQKTPQVVGKLLDLDTNEDLIREILNSVRNQCPVEPLVDEVDKRNRLRMLQPWLEARIAEGNTEPATHNAIGKLYIRMNKDPQQFLLNNRFYDSRVLGAFCEKLDPYLSFLAYKRAWGDCDEELIEMTNRNGLFKDQARYLVERQTPELWTTVLTDENEFKEQLVEEVVGTALPESKNPDEVGATVKAFMAADMPNQLIELLEKIVLQGTDFADNKNLQNLLILTAIRADTTRVMDYIQRLDNFDGPDIASIACSEENQLYEEAYMIYDKFNNHNEAIDVLLTKLENIERGREYAERVDTPDVWSRVGRSQLEALMVNEAIDSFIKASDPEQFAEVIRVAEESDFYEELIKYLIMARTKVKERKIDTELIYSYAKTSKLAELEEFIASPNVADIQSIGDRCFNEEMYEPAKLLFNNINNNSMLASCYVHLSQFREAVEAARKANSVRTWKDVNAACVLADEFRLAAICGLHIIVSPDHLEELIFHYENAGHFEHLIGLLEQGLGLESAHTGIFTELGVMYSKYKPEKLMEHCKIFWSRVNLPKLLRACEAGRHWQEATFLYCENSEFDQGAKCMMDHSPIAYEHDKFVVVIQKVRNPELHYKAVQFYLEENPRQLNKLLQVLTPKLEHARVVLLVKKSQQIALILPYLKSVQKENISAVNEAVNDCYVEDEDYDSLRNSLQDYDNLNHIGLAQQIEKHELLEFRRIASLLFKLKGRYQHSVDLSKADKMYKDAIDTAAESRDSDIVHDLLRFFVEVKDKECFCATLYTCYDCISADVVMELAWRHGLTDFAMPYLVQYTREVGEKLKVLDDRTKPPEENTVQDEVAAAAAEAAAYGYGINGHLALAATAYNDGNMNGGMGMGMPQQGMNMGGMQQGMNMGMPQQGMNMGMPQQGMNMGMPQQGMSMGGIQQGMGGF